MSTAMWAVAISNTPNQGWVGHEGRVGYRVDLGERGEKEMVIGLVWRVNDSGQRKRTRKISAYQSQMIVTASND